MGDFGARHQILSLSSLAVKVYVIRRIGHILKVLREESLDVRSINTPINVFLGYLILFIPVVVNCVLHGLNFYIIDD